MNKHIMKILLMTSVATALLITGCTKEEPISEVTVPEETAHVTEENTSEDITAEETSEDEKNEDDVVVYDPDKESVVYENYKVSLFDGFSTIKAQDYLTENIKYLTIEKADQAILDLEKRLQENQNYYINQLMEEEIQNALLLAYNLEENTFSMDDYDEDNYRTFLQSTVDNGYKFFPEEGVFYPIIDYRQLQKYDGFISDEIKSYLEIFARDSDAPSLASAELTTIAEELSLRIIMTEEHLRSYPEGQTFDRVYGAYEMYLNFYVSSLAYIGGFDADTKELNKDIKDSYLAFIKANPESTSTAILNEYLDILKSHDYKVDADVYDFLQSIKEVILKHISGTTNK